MTEDHAIFIDAAIQFGEQLCDKAITSEGRATWLGWQPSENGPLTSFGTLGSCIYDGTAGVALFLGQLFRSTAETRFRELAIGALRHSLDNASLVPSMSRRGYYSGVGGVMYLAAVYGREYESASLIEGADRLLAELCASTERALLDVISGNAGMLPVLVELDNEGWSQAAGLLRVWADEVASSSRSRSAGSSWSSEWNGCDAIEDLTGFAHGASGFSFGLDAAAEALSDPAIGRLASSARRYEDSVFDADTSNWPDFRIPEFEMDLVSAYENAFGPLTNSTIPTGPDRQFATAWCHGSPGIGLARSVSGDYSAVHRALKSTMRAVASAIGTPTNFTLCHGIAGCCDFLLQGGMAVGDSAAVQLAYDAAEDAISRYGMAIEAWPCDRAVGNTPALMNGIAGIGYFWLRLACPSSVPSPLLPGAQYAS